MPKYHIIRRNESSVPLQLAQRIQFVESRDGNNTAKILHRACSKCSGVVNSSLFLRRRAGIMSYCAAYAAPDEMSENQTFSPLIIFYMQEFSARHMRTMLSQLKSRWLRHKLKAKWQKGNEQVWIAFLDIFIFITLFFSAESHKL